MMPDMRWIKRHSTLCSWSLSVCLALAYYGYPFAAHVFLPADGMAINDSVAIDDETLLFREASPESDEHLPIADLSLDQDAAGHRLIEKSLFAHAAASKETKRSHVFSVVHGAHARLK